MAVDLLDIISTSDAKQELNITAATYDGQLETLVTAISRRLDSVCGPVVNRTVTDELHNGGRSTIWLKHRPVSSVTTVTEYTGTTSQLLTAETNAAKTATNYLLDDSRTGRLYRRTSGCDACFPSGRRNVTVTYVAGRAVNTAAVDQRFKEAARICLKHLWRAENTIGTATFGPASPLESYIPGVPTFAIPRAALEVVADELIGRGSEVPVG